MADEQKASAYDIMVIIPDFRYRYGEASLRLSSG